LEAKIVQSHTLQQRIYAADQRADENAKQVVALERLAQEKDRTIQTLQQNNYIKPENEARETTDSGDAAKEETPLEKSDENNEFDQTKKLDETKTNITPSSSPPKEILVMSPSIASPTLSESTSPTRRSRRESMMSIPTYEMTVMDATGQQSNTLGVSETDKEREKQLSQFYESRVAGLISQAQATDAKVQQLYEQHAGLLRALEEKELEKDNLLTKIKEEMALTQASKDELEDTRANYDTQIGVMTEHILQLQENLAKVENEVADLKSYKVFCGKCKAWNTLGWLVTEGKHGQKCIKGNHPVGNFML